MVTNAARAQLKKKNELFPALVCAWEFCLARQVRPSRSASATSFCKLRLDLMLIRGIPPAFHDGVRILQYGPHIRNDQLRNRSSVFFLI